jgi:hypothetical protein
MKRPCSAKRVFAEDTNYAHYVIQSLVVGEDAELWVKDNKRSEVGRTDFLYFGRRCPWRRKQY